MSATTGIDRKPPTALESARVVLFDLDGTVLTYEGSPPGPGRLALARAMKEVFACEGATDGLRMAGGTDRALARSMLVKAGLAADDGTSPASPGRGLDLEDAIARILACYLLHLGEILRTRRYSPIGDVARTVMELRARGAVVGLATGNVRDGAKLKLASAGLGSTFDLDLGGFGGDAELRADIVRIAATRCARASAATLVVVGDTEHDVRAARAVGARIVGVAMNDRARAELAAAGADAIVTECGDELVAAVLA